MGWRLPADQRIGRPAGKFSERWLVAMAIALTVPDARFDLAAREADVPQHVVVECLKLRNGALHDPFRCGIVDGARKAFAISPQQAQVGRGCRRGQHVNNSHGLTPLFFEKRLVGKSR